MAESEKGQCVAMVTQTQSSGVPAAGTSSGSGQVVLQHTNGTKEASEQEAAKRRMDEASLQGYKVEEKKRWGRESTRGGGWFDPHSQPDWMTDEWSAGHAAAADHSAKNTDFFSFTVSSNRLNTQEVCVIGLENVHKHSLPTLDDEMPCLWSD